MYRMSQATLGLANFDSFPSCEQGRLDPELEGNEDSSTSAMHSNRDRARVVACANSSRRKNCVRFWLLGHQSTLGGGHEVTQTAHLLRASCNLAEELPNEQQTV